MNIATACLVLVGLAGFAGLDGNQRWNWPDNTDYVSINPYEGVEDVYPVDAEGRLLTGVTLVDQDGNPIDISFSACDGEVNPTRPTYLIYPCRPENAPWWLESAPATTEGGG
jgi:hypothetical protein